MLSPDENNAFRRKKHPFFSSISYHLPLRKLQPDGRKHTMSAQNVYFLPRKTRFPPLFFRYFRPNEKRRSKRKGAFPLHLSSTKPVFPTGRLRASKPQLLRPAAHIGLSCPIEQAAVLPLQVGILLPQGLHALRNAASARRGKGNQPLSF